MNKIFRISLHLLFWICFFFLFIQGNWLRPYAAFHPYKEWIIGILILVGCYLVYGWIVPRYYVNGFFLKCFFVITLVWLTLCVAELLLIQTDVERFMSVLPSKYYFRRLVKMYLLVCLRNAAFLAVFFLLRTNRHYMEAYATTRYWLGQKGDVIVFPKSSDKEEGIAFNEVVYIQHHKNYTFFYLVDDSVQKRYISLLKAEEMLPADKFVRINRNTIVNKAYIVGTNAKGIVLNLKDKLGKPIELPVSPAYMETFN